MSEFRKRGWLPPHRLQDLFHGGEGEHVKVAVIDSGVEIGHPHFEGRKLADDLLIRESDQILEIDAGIGDGFGHGTAVAGVIHSTAPKCTIGSFRVINADSRIAHNKSLVAEKIAIAAQEAIRRGYHVLNCSFGDPDFQNIKRHKDWIDLAYVKGVHVVAACNNQNFNKPEYPGYFSSVISVNMSRGEADRSFYFLPNHLVEFASAGVWVKVPWKGGGISEQIGSSYAAPRLAGILARMLSIQPDLSPTEAKAVLHHLAKPWSSDIAGPNQSIHV